MPPSVTCRPGSPCRREFGGAGLGAVEGVLVDQRLVHVRRRGDPVRFGRRAAGGGAGPDLAPGVLDVGDDPPDSDCGPSPVGRWRGVLVRVAVELRRDGGKGKAVVGTPVEDLLDDCGGVPVRDEEGPPCAPSAGVGDPDALGSVAVGRWPDLVAGADDVDHRLVCASGGFGVVRGEHRALDVVAAGIDRFGVTDLVIRTGLGVTAVADRWVHRLVHSRDHHGGRVWATGVPVQWWPAAARSAARLRRNVGCQPHSGQYGRVVMPLAASRGR
jgi:hypothetical protein